ncbi:helix-turn-helix transcriptional regulator [Edwardsiella tarda]|uniref:helix-turn-helix transcriptional regulator n=1 Tax=Edwardsiella tarda TaxID=636 RepID=UPI00098ECB03|nr:AraC family transcriptional regulator [Edwardsiella tarda]
MPQPVIPVPTLQEISARQSHQLRRVTLFSPALCLIRQGSKTIQWGERCEVAGEASLVLFPAGSEVCMANQPGGGYYRAEMLYLPAALLQQFRRRYPQPTPPEGASRSCCLAMTPTLTLLWQQLLQGLRLPLAPTLLNHLAEGLLLALQPSGHSALLLHERHDRLTEQIQQLLLLDPAHTWQAGEVAQRLHMAESTLRRRLSAEGKSFRDILDEVRLGQALLAIQSGNAPIGDIAGQSGYASPSRFTARFVRRYGLTPSALRQALRQPDAPQAGSALV